MSSPAMMPSPADRLRPAKQPPTGGAASGSSASTTVAARILSGYAPLDVHSLVARSSPGGYLESSLCTPRLTRTSAALTCS